MHIHQGADTEYRQMVHRLHQLSHQNIMSHTMSCPVFLHENLSHSFEECIIEAVGEKAIY